MSARLTALLRGFGVLLYRLRLHRMVMWLNRGAPKLLLYHACEPAESDYIKGLNSNTPPATFAAHLEFLRRHYVICSMADFERGALPPNAVVITFDDGYRSMYEYAFPLLRARSLPAVLYLVTGVVGNSALVWINELNWLVRHAPEVGRPLIAADLGVPADTPLESLLVLACERYDRDRVRRWLETLRRAAGGAPRARLYVTWDEAREMAAAGVTLGNHTVTHPGLPGIDELSQQQEMEGAQQALREHLGTPATTFAYPFGYWNDASRRAAAAVGFRSVVEVGGSNERLRYDRVGRVPVAAEDVAELFAQMEVVTPIKGRIKRWLTRREAAPAAASAPTSA